MLSDSIKTTFIKRCKREEQVNFASRSSVHMEAKDLNTQIDGKADTSVGSDLHWGIYWQNCLYNDTAVDTISLWIYFCNNRFKRVTTFWSKTAHQVMQWYMLGAASLFRVKSSLVSLYVCRATPRH